MKSNREPSDAYLEVAGDTHALPPTAPLMSAAEVAELFSVHPSTIRRMARESRIPAYWVGSTPRFDATEIACAFRKEAKEPPRPPRPSRQGGRSNSLGLPGTPDNAGRVTRFDRKRLRSQLYL